MRDYLSDVAAERAVLASVFRFGSEAYADVADIVTSNTFSLENNQAVWKCIEHAFKDPTTASIDYPTIISSASALGLSECFKSDGDTKHLRSIMNTPIMPENGRRMAGRIRKFEVAALLERQLEEARRSIRGLTGDETINQIIAAAEQPIFDFTSLLTDAARTGPQLMGTDAVKYMTHLMDNPRDMCGISTGLNKFDLAIGGGLRPNSLDLIVARMKVGKTQVADNVALHIADVEETPVFNVDTEMTVEEHQTRIIANLAGIPIKLIETGKCGFNSFDRQKVLEAAAKLESLPYYYECMIGREFEEVLGSLRRWVTRTVGLRADGKANRCVVIYDYLKMLSSDFAAGNMQEYQALGYITTALKNFMGRYGVPCLCFAQANREGIEKEDTGIIGGSDRIAQYATSVTLYKFKTEEERVEAGASGMKYTHKLVPIVSRHGEGLQDGDYINIQAEYGQARITEGPTRNELSSKGGGDMVRNVQGFIVNNDDQADCQF